MWIQDQSGFNPKLGEKLKIAGKKIKQGVGNVKNKVFGTPKKKQNWSGETGTKRPNEKLKTWRVDSAENKRLQEERKSGKDETFSRKTTNNKKDIKINKDNKINKKSGKKKSEMGKAEWLKATRNSPAAKAFGNSPEANEKRWLRQVEHRKKKWKKK
jgi:hypothetical protein